VIVKTSNLDILATQSHANRRQQLSILTVALACTLGIISCNTYAQEDVTTDKKNNSINIWKPKPKTTWVWQLQNYSSMDTSLNVTAYDIDLFEGMEDKPNSLIKQLKNNGKKVICYFSAGTREDWRPDAHKFTEGTVIADGEMKDWPGEAWLNIGDPDALETIKTIMQARLQSAKDAGCDAVEPDNVDGYDNIEETNGAINATDQITYNKWLAEAAHAIGLSIGLKNDINQLKELAPYFDFAVNEQCYAFGNECVAYESTFISADKAVFNQEYHDDSGQGMITEEQFLSNACSYFFGAGISAIWQEGVDLEGGEFLFCPGEYIEDEEEYDSESNDDNEEYDSESNDDDEEYSSESNDDNEEYDSESNDDNEEYDSESNDDDEEYSSESNDDNEEYDSESNDDDEEYSSESDDDNEEYDSESNDDDEEYTSGSNKDHDECGAENEDNTNSSNNYRKRRWRHWHHH
jgi:hypothetical protein